MFLVPYILYLHKSTTTLIILQSNLCFVNAECTFCFECIWVCIPLVCVCMCVCVYKKQWWCRREPIPDGAVSRPEASQVFLSKWRPNDRHIPSPFHLGNHAINQPNIATLPLITAPRETAGAERRGGGAQGHKGTEWGHFWWSANNAAPGKVIWESDCFLEIVFHFAVMELWEVADSCFNFHCVCSWWPGGESMAQTFLRQQRRSIWPGGVIKCSQAHFS